MLNFHVRWVDLTAYPPGGAQPVFVFERPHAGAGPRQIGSSPSARVGKFWVPQVPPFDPNADPNEQWTFTAAGDHVRVPIMAFRTASRSEAAVWGLGVQVGAAALASLARVTHERPTEVILVFGGRADDLFPEGAYRCYVGIAVRTL